MMMLRFLLVGVVNTAVGLGVTFGAKYGLGWSYWPSTLTGLVVGAFISFFLNRKYTFRAKTPTGGALARFLVVISSCYVLAYTLSYQVSRRLLVPLGFNDAITEDAAVILGMAGYTIMNYFSQKYIVFRLSKSPPIRT